MDQYPDVSRRTQRERERRGAGGSIQIAINHDNQKCPTQWKKYMSDGSNKANLASFLVQEWQQPEYFVRFADFGSLFVTHGMECHKLTAGENGIDSNSTSAFVGKGKRQAFHYGRVRPEHVGCHDDGW